MKTDTPQQESRTTATKATEDAVRHAHASLTEAGVAAKTLADQGIDAVRNSAAEVEDVAARIGNRASAYIQEQPLKSLLIATAAGALIAIIAGKASRH